MKLIVLRAPELAKPASLQIPVSWLAVNLKLITLQMWRHLYCLLLPPGISLILNNTQGMLQGVLSFHHNPQRHVLS